MTAYQPADRPITPPVMYRNGFGITALCLAIPGLLFGLAPITGFLGVILGVLGLIFGILGIARVCRGVANNKWMAWISTALAAAATALGIFAMVLFFQVTGEFVNDMNRISSQGSAPAPQEGGVAPAPIVPPGSDQVTVKVTGTLDKATIDYYVGPDMGATTEPLPFTHTATATPMDMPTDVLVTTPIPADISTPIPSGTISCQILIDGVVVDENTASGQGPMVTCSEPGGY